MKRSERKAASIQQSPAAVATAPAEAAADPRPPDAPKAAGLTWGWRVALFIWASAFLCLVAFELLSTLVRSLSRLF